MAKTAKYTKSEVLRAIRGDPEARKPQADKGDPFGTLWKDDKRISSYGHIPTIAARLGCTEQTVRNYASRKNRDGDVTRQAQDIAAAIAHEHELGLIQRADFHKVLIRDAEKALHANVKLHDTQSIKFALERLDKANYAARSEMTGADGETLFDDEARRALSELAQMLDDMGKDPSETMIDAVHALKAKLLAVKNRGKDDDDDNTHSMERE